MKKKKIRFFLPSRLDDPLKFYMYLYISIIFVTCYRVNIDKSAEIFR